MKSPLTDKQVRAITDVGRHWVAQGLYLEITKAGTRTYLARATLPDGRRTWRSIGSQDKVSIGEARKQAMQDYAEVETSRKFADVFADFIKTKQHEWKNEASHQQWLQTFEDYIQPKLGHAPIADIKPAMVAELLAPLWLTKSETARRVRSRIASTIDFEQARQGVIEANPADLRFIKRLLPKQRDRDQHFEAPTLDQLRVLYQALDDKHVAHRCLRWLIHHVCRTTEAREAVYSEIHGDTWVIPPERMKGGREHVSPIIEPVELGTGLMFAINNEPLSINGMRSVLVKRDYLWTVHGIRSCFSSWASEQGVDSRVVERQLAHVDANQVRAAYDRSDLLEARRELLTQWIKTLRVAQLNDIQ